MKFYKIFLFYYGLIATTVLLVVSFFFLPQPQNIATSIVLLPVAFLFWVHATNPSKVSASQWSVRFLIVVIIFSILGIFSYFLAARYLPQSTPIGEEPTLSEIKKIVEEGEKNNEEFRHYVTQEIEDIKDKLAYLEEGEGKTLGTSILEKIDKSLDYSEYIIPVGVVTIKDSKWQSINVYSSNSTSSKTIGVAKYGNDYPFYESKGDWYLIDGFESSSEAIEKGWIKAEFVKEVSGNQ